MQLFAIFWHCLFTRNHALEIQHFKGHSMGDDTTRFAQVIGQAALHLWPDLPRAIQERLFEDAVAADEALRHKLALYLHDHHPRTAHPPKPTALA
jgi:hypothetical protein